MAIDAIPAEYSYDKGTASIFINTENYEEIPLEKSIIKDKLPYLTSNQPVLLVYCDGFLINVQLPMNVELKIVETSPTLKTATITNVAKPAVMETGLVVQVPAFVEQGEVIKVDTRDGSYIERVKK